MQETHVVEDSETSSGAALRLLPLLSQDVLLFGRLQAHGDHLRTSQHL